MRLSLHERLLLVLTLFYMALFTAVALRGSNHEFLLYAAVVLALCIFVAARQYVLCFGPGILWGLSAWGLMHMAGGNVRVGNGVLYSVQLIPVVLRYDQFVHAFGFGAATLACAHLLRPHLAAGALRRISVKCMIMLTGCGLGALNEVIEFGAVKLFPETGVGGYDNTMLDLLFNLIGAALATLFGVGGRHGER